MTGRESPIQTYQTPMLSFEEEAEDCRRKALAYVGQPEAPFLLRIAREFDRLASERLLPRREQL